MMRFGLGLALLAGALAASLSFGALAQDFDTAFIVLSRHIYVSQVQDQGITAQLRKLGVDNSREKKLIRFVTPGRKTRKNLPGGLHGRGQITDRRGCAGVNGERGGISIGTCPPAFTDRFQSRAGSPARH